MGSVVKYIQGDIVGVYNSAGTKVVGFRYDAFGRCTVIGDVNLAQWCRIRYRGYYYDTETGLYWVQTRYYNPDWCRWISILDRRILKMERKYWIKKIFVMLMVCLLVVLLAGCHFYEMHDKLLAKKMTEKYSDNLNYITLVGEVIECNDNHVIIESNELKPYLSYVDGPVEYFIYADSFIELKVGEQIEFTTVPFHFYNGHELPIVELKLNGNTLLSFEKGKENLLEWVNATFL